MTLENMARAWEELSEDQRLPKDEEKSFFDDCKQTCFEILQRWHTGESSHPDREELAKEYSCDADGAEQLRKDLFAIKDDPFVSAADLKLRLVKYTAPPRD
eukprot:CAMPEP_0206444370 /NCGR_PEP_ID=MMETSP0324_2-20121206/14874_1 /ASSEMBLY_ACC=CAM_ASM_000836 /TAXON_ID=2866 /ORGANISM="Crypthecodinium cohnii, Strain Seligo" /LENGTH=100 /DNA_ID=CAMNT_0053912385 /DNA_START=124 /DNA_END=426 /DNA_ORIENTATION=-